MTYDVVIVGSGAGGGIAAYVLAMSGANVCVLEKGPNLTEEHFGDDELRFGERILIDQDPLMEPRTFRNRREDGDRLFTGQVLPVSRCVGGGSVHYAAVSFRYRPEDLLARTTWGDLPGADIVDWPVSYDQLVPYYRKAERLLGVAGGQMRGDPRPGHPVPGAEWRIDPYPMPGHPANYGALLFERASRSLGFHPFPTPVVIDNGRYVVDDPSLLPDGVPLVREGCSYCGFCSSHGCPIGAKGDTRVTALALAQRTGRCEIRAECHVGRVEVRGGRARRVIYIDPDGVEQAVEGRVVILACSTVDTPRLVLLSEMPRDQVNHDLVGRYLMVHHFPGGVGFFDERIDYYKGFWSMRCLDDFYMGPPGSDSRMFGFGNVQTVGPSSGYPLMTGGIISTAKTLPWGRAHKEEMRQVFGRFQFLGMIGDDPPVRTNMVDLDPHVKDVWGLPVPRVTYQHHPNDYAVASIVMPWLDAIFAEMGAVSTQRVAGAGITTALPQMGKTGEGQRSAGRGFPDPIGGLVNHQMGTMRMGAHPDTSVVDPEQRVWGVENLYVMDASVFPTSGGYNPTLTIQALAWRAAERLAARLS